MFDPAEGASGGELDPDTVLGVGIAQYAGRLVLRLRYRADVIDADSAARIFGYYRTALELIAADPDAGPGRQSLLSADELRYQIEGLAGRAGRCRSGASTSCSSSGPPPTRTPSRPATARSGGPTGNSTPGPTGWRAPCGCGGCAAKTSSRS